MSCLGFCGAIYFLASSRQRGSILQEKNYAIWVKEFKVREETKKVRGGDMEWRQTDIDFFFFLILIDGAGELALI